MQKISVLQSSIAKFENLVSRFEDATVMCEIADEEDDEEDGDEEDEEDEEDL